MVVLDRPADLQAWIGKEIGVSEWLAIDQSRIDDFARLSGDDHWLHVDVERAKRDMPDGKTIAHGFMTLSFIPYLVRSVYAITHRGRGLNYGMNRVRFVNPVQVGDRIRLRQRIKEVERGEGGGQQGATRVVSECTIEIEGKERPALVAEFLMLVYDE
ncbi:putative enoyl-CoA hydratase 1 [Pigmentiphaga humi]|uniref:Putative enoyl-CoA hydratase 1 n=1 Tax=Pigmentiphaga humi TaxID=2478468 RepID=A0A3P4B415_9BURK|nr:MaoC family dehydratase [Pigmentiphaga humi]VCU71029.1 putative enoyl-CoA hydratase 1 [Pigmentiphaga humi]